MPKLGYKQTEAHRAAISAGVRGKQISEVARERMRLAHLGHSFSTASREKMAAAKRGKKQPEEVVEKRMAGRRAAAERRALERANPSALAQDARPAAADGTHPRTFAEIMQIAHETRARAAALQHESSAAQARINAVLDQAAGRLTFARDQLAKHRARGVAVISDQRLPSHEALTHTASA